MCEKRLEGLKRTYHRVTNPYIVFMFGERDCEFGAEIVWYEERAVIPGLGKVTLGSLVEIAPGKKRMFFLLLNKEQAAFVRGLNLSIVVKRRVLGEVGNSLYISFPTEEQFVKIAESAAEIK